MWCPSVLPSIPFFFAFDENFYCFSIPSLLLTIQNRLLDCISIAVSRSHHPQVRQATRSQGNVLSTAAVISDFSGPALVQLALRTLAHFNFKVCTLSSPG